MITGDHARTAAVIAAELGIAADGLAVTGVELEKMPEEMLDQMVREVSVYARVNPEHKLRIVKALQHDGMTVALLDARSLPHGLARLPKKLGGWRRS